MCAEIAEHALPFYGTTLVGREAESALLHRLIEDPGVRLITVTGTAGVGKTRLTTAIASTLLQAGCDGVIFVPMVTVTDPTLVAAEIGKALDLQGDDLIGAIRTRFSAHQGVVLLDNLEQVIQCAPEIAAMLPDNPELTVIATSQRPLHIQGERVVRLYPLPVPGEDDHGDDLRQSPSVQLMLDRATDMDVSLLDANDDPAATEVIAEICRRLDGIPLALELAASRLASLSPEVVLAQLERGRQILTSERRDIPERQRTMHSAIAWSFDLLPPDTQRIFLWLGAFPSGFDLDLVDQVTQQLGQSTASVDTVSELINLSLVRRVSGGARPWYIILQSIREFCRVELDASGERDAAQAMLTDHVLELADKTEEILTGRDVGDWKSRLDREFWNIRAAVMWSLEHENPEVPFLVAAGMWRYFEQEGRWQEAVGWVTQAQAWQDKLQEEVLIAGLIAKMTMQEDGRDISGALATGAKVERMLQGNDYPEYEVQYLLRSGSIAQDQQKLGEAFQHFARAAELAEHHGIVRNLAVARGNLGIIDYLRGRLPEAETNFLKVKESLAQLGDKTGMANILSNLAATATLRDAPERALGYLEEASVFIDELGLRRDQIYTLLNKASAYIALEEFDAAANASEEAIELAQDLNYPLLQATGYVNLTETYLQQGRISSSAAMMLRALGAITPEEGSRHMVEIGILLSDALVREDRYAVAAAVLDKTLAFAAEIEFSFDPQQRRRIQRVNDALDRHQAETADARTRAALWTTAEFFHKLGLYSRRLTSTSAGVLVAAAQHHQPLEEAGEHPDELAGLTPREREILQLLIEGNSTRDMADAMSVSPRTVTTHLGNMMAKLEVSSRAELVAKVLRDR